METVLLLKAIADETRMKILTLLLKYNYCVRALAKELELSESTVSQHLKALREAGLVTGKKRGYFMHYDVERDVLRALAGDIDALVSVKREICPPGAGRCKYALLEKCSAKKCCTVEEAALCREKRMLFQSKTKGKKGTSDENCGNF